MSTFYRTGIDDRGRSCVLERRPISREAGSFRALVVDDAVPPVPDSGPDVALLEQLTVPGGVFSNFQVWEAGARTPMHRTVSIDFDVVLAGTVDMELEAETVALSAGDVVVVPGVAHAWAAGPEGAIVMYNLVAGAPTGRDIGRRGGAHEALEEE